MPENGPSSLQAARDQLIAVRELLDSEKQFAAAAYVDTALAALLESSPALPALNRSARATSGELADPLNPSRICLSGSVLSQ